MSRTANPAAHPTSRLIQALQALGVLDGRLPHAQFVATLSKMIDFAGAMNLSEFLAGLPHIAVASKAVDKDAVLDVKTQYLQARGEMIRFIAQSFVIAEGRAMAKGSVIAKGFPETRQPSALSLPDTRDAMAENDLGLVAYQRFYSLQQSEMEGKILKLHLNIRRSVASHSSQLAQLVALDTQLSTILSSYSRKALSGVSALLAKRFRYLCLDPSINDDKDTEAEDGLPVFLIEMQGLLLAELDIRLQPTLGLIDALDTEQEENT